MPAEMTRRKRNLGRYMESLRKRPDRTLTAEMVADRAETSRTTISRMESGLQAPHKHLFVAILGALDATDTERTTALELWRRAKQPTITVEHAADLSAKYIAFRRDEAEASAELTLNYAALPGLLQTADYAGALADADPSFTGDHEGWELRSGEERLARQQLLSGDFPLRLHAILSEAVLRYEVGGRAVWIEQLEHLVTVSQQDNITLQVVPFDRGAFGPMTGPVLILQFDDDSTSVYLEYPAGGETIDKQEDVAGFVSTFDRVKALACAEDESVAMIRSTLTNAKDTG